MQVNHTKHVNKEGDCLMDYSKDITQEAKDFIEQHEDDIKEAIKNDAEWDYNDMEFLDSSWHSDIVDRSYSLEDAAYIVENSDNTESDSGLWEGQEPRDALVTQAAYSYANDVWFECQRIYDEMKSDYQDRKINDDDETNEDIDIDAENNKILDEIFKEFTIDNLQPVEKGSHNEKYLIQKWLKLNENAGLWGGYPVGSSYIDARCGSGHSMPDIKDYVDFDREFAKQVPHLNNKRKNDVKAYYEQTWKKTEAVTQ
jgi:hypothetical protein